MNPWALQISSALALPLLPLASGATYLDVLPSLHKLKYVPVVRSFRRIDLHLFNKCFYYVCMYACRLSCQKTNKLTLRWPKEIYITKGSIYRVPLSIYICIYDWHRDILRENDNSMISVKLIQLFCDRAGMNIHCSSFSTNSYWMTSVDQASH